MKHALAFMDTPLGLFHNSELLLRAPPLRLWCVHGGVSWIACV